MAVVLATAAKVGFAPATPTQISPVVPATAKPLGAPRLTCRWVIDPATGRLVCQWDNDPLPRRYDLVERWQAWRRARIPLRPSRS